MCYCQQLAVPCYPQTIVDDINRQITALKAEYRAFTNKLRLLEPDRAITDHRYRLKRANEGKYCTSLYISFILSSFVNMFKYYIQLSSCFV